jgi:hypothetical protein
MAAVNRWRLWAVREFAEKSAIMKFESSWQNCRANVAEINNKLAGFCQVKKLFITEELCQAFGERE